MKNFTLLFAILIASICYAQEKKGYYINSNNQKVEGYLQSPTILEPETVKFKPLTGGEYVPLELNNVIEYGITNEIKLQKHTVDIDMSAGNTASASREPEWTTMNIFLNVIAEGNACLYSYTVNNFTRYFYSVKSKNIKVKQLVHKKFLKASHTVDENNAFRQQLFTDVKCVDDSGRGFPKIMYYQDELTNVIRKFNDCTSSDTATSSSTATSTTFAQNEVRKTAVKFTLYAGTDFTSVEVKTDKSNLTTTKDNTVSPSVGVELALRILKGDYEFFTRFEYEKLNATVQNTYTFSSYNTVTEKHILEADVLNFYLGARKNFALAAKSKIFVDGALCISNPIGDWIMLRTAYNAGGSYVMTGDIQGLRSAFSFNLGLGYAFNDTYGISLRYDTKRNMFSGLSTSDETRISKLSINLRYTIK